MEQVNGQIASANDEKLAVLFIQLIFCLLLVFSLPAQAGSTVQNRNTMPGQLYDIGTHRLHLFCSGEGTPTIVIDSGMGGFSLEWQTVQESLSMKSRVCTYDRAGYGWSDPGPEPRTTQQITKELHTLLEVAQVGGPYILVGHSFGGYNIRYFASTYPHDIAGLVLIDASHPEQFLRLPAPKPLKTIVRKNSYTVRISMPVIPDNFPEQKKQLAFALMANFKALRTKEQEWENFRISADQVTEINNLPDVPLAVVTRGQRVWPRTPFGDESEKVWQEMQDDLCHLTSHVEHYMAKRSGHLVHLDQPELVMNAINQTVDKANEIRAVRMAALEQRPLRLSDNWLMSVNNYSSAVIYNNHLYSLPIADEHIRYYQPLHTSSF